MNASDLYGKSIDCSCGRTHNIEPAEIIYEENAAARLPEILKRYSN